MQGTVPYLGTFLTDLTMLDTALQDYIEVFLGNFYCMHLCIFYSAVCMCSCIFHCVLVCFSKLEESGSKKRREYAFLLALGTMREFKNAIYFNRQAQHCILSYQLRKKIWRKKEGGIPLFYFIFLKKGFRYKNVCEELVKHTESQLWYFRGIAEVFQYLLRGIWALKWLKTSNFSLAEQAEGHQLSTGRKKGLQGSLVI